MKKQNVHITPHPGGDWQVKRSGNEKASAVLPTQKDAITTGREMAIKAKTELVIHGRDGKIRDSDSYGNDPCPPKDRKY